MAYGDQASRQDDRDQNRQRQRGQTWRSAHAEWFAKLLALALTFYKRSSMQQGSFFASRSFSLASPITNTALPRVIDVLICDWPVVCGGLFGSSYN